MFTSQNPEPGIRHFALLSAQRATSGLMQRSKTARLPQFSA
jgi:hypothetical protein